VEKPKPPSAVEPPEVDPELEVKLDPELELVPVPEVEPAPELAAVLDPELAVAPEFELEIDRELEPALDCVLDAELAPVPPPGVTQRPFTQFMPEGQASSGPQPRAPEPKDSTQPAKRKVAAANWQR
jgi:hypothetical protein